MSNYIEKSDGKEMLFKNRIKELLYKVKEDEMRALRTEQLDWIELRDNKALEASLEYKGGTMESLVYVSKLATVTERRCYELVENYVK